MFEIKRIQSKTLQDKIYEPSIEFSADIDMFEHLVSNIYLFDGYGSDIFNNNKLVGHTSDYMNILK